MLRGPPGGGNRRAERVDDGRKSRRTKDILVAKGARQPGRLRGIQAVAYGGVSGNRFPGSALPALIPVRGEVVLARYAPPAANS